MLTPLSQEPHYRDSDKLTRAFYTKRVCYSPGGSLKHKRSILKYCDGRSVFSSLSRELDWALPGSLGSRQGWVSVVLTITVGSWRGGRGLLPELLVMKIWGEIQALYCEQASQGLSNTGIYRQHFEKLWIK